MTFTVGPNRQAKKLELRYFQGKCLHYYFYLIDSQWGWLNVRLQTWLPFTAQIVVNGRERLAQRKRSANCILSCGVGWSGGGTPVSDTQEERCRGEERA
jgi:hypothetical protein